MEYNLQEKLLMEVSRGVDELIKHEKCISMFEQMIYINIVFI
jgi:hypothetical protein